MMNNLNTLGIALLFLICSCASTNLSLLTDGSKETETSLETLEFTVEEAPEWSALFNRTSGWFGGDGIFSIPMDGKENETAKDDTETMFLFSDSMIGEISDSSLHPGWSMVNNTVAYLNGNNPHEDKISFHWDKAADGKPKTFFIPTTPSAEKGDYYWLGDGFINTELDNTLFVFAYRMRNLDAEEAWSFKEMGTNLIVLPKGSRPPFKNHRQLETPFHFEEGGFGAGVFVNTKAAGAPNPDGHIYIYGVKGKEKSLMVARVMAKDFVDFKAWRFWDGKEWNDDGQQAASVTQDVSNELSVSPLPDGRYALIFQLNTMGPIVGLRLANTPYGPFGPVIKIYECSEGQQKNYFTYNAKAHPHLSAPGELLISYNVNALDFLNEINQNPNLYRPRFIRLKFK